MEVEPSLSPVRRLVQILDDAPHIHEREERVRDDITGHNVHLDRRYQHADTSLGDEHYQTATNAASVPRLLCSPAQHLQRLSTTSSANRELLRSAAHCRRTHGATQRHMRNHWPVHPAATRIALQQRIGARTHT